MELINLEVKPMLGGLYSKDVITTEHSEVISNKVTKRERMEYLLNQFIIPSLKAGMIDKFKGFLEVMESSEDIAVTTVGQRLGTL